MAWCQIKPRYINVLGVPLFYQFGLVMIFFYTTHFLLLVFYLCSMNDSMKLSSEQYLSRVQTLVDTGVTKTSIGRRN